MTSQQDCGDTADGRGNPILKIVGLVAAHALAALTLSVAGYARTDLVVRLMRGTYLLPAAIGFSVSHLALVAIWSAVGRTFWIVRWTASAAVVVCVSALV